MLLSDFQRRGERFAELGYLTSVAVGFPVSVYWMGDVGPDAPNTHYQVMRRDEGPGPGYEFWQIQLGREQFFPTPEAACAAFLDNYRTWAKLAPG